MKTKVKITSTEWHPVYLIEDTGQRYEIEADEATIQRWKKAHDLFLKSQEEIFSALKKSGFSV